MTIDTLADAPIAGSGAAPARRSALERLLSPRSIAMVGASNNPNGLGGMVFANLKRSFKGPLHPVHPSDPEVMGLPAHRALSALSEPVDLAVIAVPALATPEVIAQAAALGCGGAAVLSAGFAEIGDEGAALQAQITAAARTSGLRLMGPNCIGFMNLHGGVMANFALNPAQPLPRAGGVALVSQSGGFGSYITTMAIRAGLRLGWFVSTGNEADCNVATILRHLVEQPEVSVLLACAETLRDPDVFVEAAVRALELDKPIVLLKMGRSPEAARAALSHTGSIAGSAEVLDAVCAQYGVHIVHTMQQLLDLGLIFQDGRRVRGRRLGILTTSGGAGVLLADDAGQAGLTVPELPAEEQAALRALMPTPFYGNVANPVDTTAQGLARPGAVTDVVAAMGQSRAFDLMAAVAWAEASSLIAAYIATYQGDERPFAVLSTDYTEALQDAGLPTYLDPRGVVQALAAVARQSLDRPSPPGAGTIQLDAARAARARAIIAEAGEERVLMEHQGKRLLAEYGVRVTDERFAADVEAAVAAAVELDRPVAVKIMSPQILHKSDVGGVRLGLRGADAVRSACQAMLADVAERAPAAHIAGFLVQEMAPARVEMSCGLRRDPVFGPMVAVSVGGVLIEVIAEAALLRPPFGLAEARKAISGLLQGRLVTARRGLDETECDALARVMVALGQLALEAPEIEEADVNPVRIADGVAIGADALFALSKP